MAVAPTNTFGSGDFFGKAYTFFDGQLINFLNLHLSNVLDAVRGPLLGALVIYLAIYAILIMRGVVQEPLQDFIWRGAKLALLFAAASTVAYQDWIVEPLYNAAPGAVSQAISGADYKDAGASFDKLLNKAAAVYQRLQTEAAAQPITNIGIALSMTFSALILELAAAIACIVGFALTIFALIGLAITICLGPIFIALSLFEWGKGMFQGWLRQAFNYIVQLAVITTMSELIIALGDEIIKNNTAVTSVQQAMFLVIYYLLGAFFFFQAPSVASGITGGSGLSAGELVAGAAGAAAFGAGKAGRALESAGKSAAASGRSARGAGRWAANKFRNRNSIAG